MPPTAPGAAKPSHRVIRISHPLMHPPAARAPPHRQDGWQARLAELLGAVNLKPEVADLFPHQLSGGMKQRVCIAIAISLRPRLIIADEPTSALDVVVQRRVMQTLRKVQRQIGAAVILIGHDMGLMAQFAQRVAVMKSGRIVELGEVRQIFAQPSHPYTRLLMHSLPSLDPEDRARLLNEVGPEPLAVAEPV